MTYGVFMFLILIICVGAFGLILLDEVYDITDKFGNWLYETVIKVQKKLEEL